jgi:Flp pilus assembly protein TadD
MLEPGQRVDHSERAASLIEMAKFGHAAHEAQRALAQHPDDIEAHYLLAFALLGQGKLAAAETEARLAVSLAPGYAPAHSVLAQALDKRNKRREARKHYERALALEPSEPQFLVSYADSLFRAGKVDEALFHVDAALQLAPRDVTAHLLRGSCLMDRDPETAEAAFLQALAIDPNDFRAHLLLGEIYLWVHDDGRRAAACFRQALHADPNNEFVKTELIRVWAARLPVLGVFWRFARTRWPHRLSWLVIMTLLLAWCFLSEWAKPEMVLIYGICFALALLWGLFVWLVDPLITRAVLRGWIK